jgi:succinate dehydrogenase / fumarate reductase, cytochrome b subunit
MSRVVGFYQTSVGKKIVMAISGLILWGFVIGHMLGNLKVYMGPEAFNHYAEGLRTFGQPFFGRGQVLWLVRIILLAAVALHIIAAAQLVLASKRARKTGYKRFDSLAFSFASRTMAWGGVTILAFVIYHLMHFTFGNVHPDFVPGDAYHNFVTGFQRVPVSLAYMAAMIPLGFHMYHGLWSTFQTLGANNPAYNRWRRPLALTIALIVILMNLSFPVSVMSGGLRPAPLDGSIVQGERR